MELVEQIWNYVLPIGSGLTIGAILIAVGSIVLRSVVNKTIGNINLEEIEKKAIENTVGKIKEISFKQTIQPVVESGLQKVNEKAIELISERFSLLDEKYNNIINCLDKFYSYFDNSIGVSDEKKKELKEAISIAKDEIIEPIEELEISITDEIVEKVEQVEKKSNTVNVER